VADAETKYHTSGIVPLTRPQLVGTLTGLLLAALLAAIAQAERGEVVSWEQLRERLRRFG